MHLSDMIKTLSLNGGKHTQFQLIEGNLKFPVDADTLKDLGKRMVFVIARPLPGIAGYIPSGSQFQRSHWAAIVCDEDWDADRIRALFSDLNTNSQRGNEDLGFLFQLFRAGGGISGSLSSGLSSIPSFTTRDLVETYPKCLIIFVGMTNLENEEIVKMGYKIFNDNPKYRLLSNNCQNWTQHLVEEITGQKNCPSPLSDLILVFD